MKKPQHDGDLRRNRSDGDKGLFVYIVMIYLGRIRLMKKPKKKGWIAQEHFNRFYRWIAQEHTASAHSVLSDHKKKVEESTKERT